MSQLVSTAWASASTFRNSDKRGGANGARIRLEPQRGWAVNEPETPRARPGHAGARSARVSTTPNATARRISLADLIVLGGCAAIERAASGAGHDIEVPFRQGRTDATQEWTDVEWFSALEPTADAFRNYVGTDSRFPAEHLLVDRASQLTLNAREMTVLLGGLRVLGANHGESPLGVFTSTPGTLTTDFFVNLLDPDTEWAPTTDCVTRHGDLRGPRPATPARSRDRQSRRPRLLGHPVLRAISEEYASQDGEEKFVRDFVSAWDKVMNLDLFDRS